MANPRAATFAKRMRRRTLPRAGGHESRLARHVHDAPPDASPRSGHLSNINRGGLDLDLSNSVRLTNVAILGDRGIFWNGGEYRFARLLFLVRQFRLWPLG